MSFSLELYKQAEIKESSIYGCVLHYKVIVLSGRTLAKALIIFPITVLLHGLELEGTERICNYFK